MQYWAKARRAFRLQDKTGFESTAWVGGTHGAGSKTVSCDLSWFDQRSVKIFKGFGYLQGGVVGGEKKGKSASEAEEEPECAEVVVFAEGEHMPDHIRGAKTSLSLLRSFLPALRLSISVIHADKTYVGQESSSWKA